MVNDGQVIFSWYSSWTWFHRMFIVQCKFSTSMHAALLQTTHLRYPIVWNLTVHILVGLRTIAVFTVKRRPWAVAVPYHKPYFHQDLRPYIYGAITAMSNIAWLRLKPSRLGLDSPFDAISAARPDFPHLPIARRRPPMARCYAVPYREPLSLTEIRPFCYGRHRYGTVRTPTF